MYIYIHIINMIMLFIIINNNYFNFYLFTKGESVEVVS